MPATGPPRAHILDNASPSRDAPATPLRRPPSAFTPPDYAPVPPSPSSDRSMVSAPEDRIEDAIAPVPKAAGAGDALACEAFDNKHIYELATQVATLLKGIVEQNDRIPFTSEELTRFHSRAPPGISIRDYLVRIIKFCSLDKAILLVLLYFVDLFSQSYARFSLNTLTVHRFLITAATVASKGLCDQFCSNTHYAKVGGISVIELNLLEVEFLTRVHYRIVAPTSLFWQYFVKCEETGATLPSPRIEASPARKHAREDSSPGVGQLAAQTTAPTSAPPPRPRGLRAVRDTLRFLHTTKRKKEDDVANV